MIHANNAGTSWPKPREVHDAVAAALAAPPGAAPRILEESRAEICGFLGVPDPSRLLLTPGCTSALAVAIGDLPWKPGDAILTSSLEHHALARPVEKLVRERGAVHRAAPYRPGNPIDLDFVRATLREGKVRLVAVTAASNVTGEILPVEEVASLAREHGALCLVDAAQTAGLLPVDVRTLGADILVFAGHKATLGPQGIGGLWAAPSAVFQSPSAACEIDSRPRGAGSCDPFPGHCDVGSANVAGAAGLAAGMRWLERRGRSEMGRSPRALAARLVQAVRDCRGVTIHGAPDAARTAAVSVTLENLPLARAESYFAERGILVRAAQHCAPMALRAIGAPAGTIRVSFGPFNEEGDAEAIAAAILEAAS